jgi:hypothetical protein
MYFKCLVAKEIYWLEIRVPFMLVTEVDWRIPGNGNSYFNLEFAKPDLARIAQFDLGAVTGYKRIRTVRGGFFEKAAFYGDTALRIFHGLDLFSEDLDFSFYGLILTSRWKNASMQFRRSFKP